MRVCSATHFLILPSVICCEMFSGLPISATCFSTTCRSSSRAPAGMSSGETHIGRMEATCSATLRANSLNSGVRATKSVSQLTSTSTPTRPLKCTYASISPSVAALALFLAARAWPLSLRTFLAPSTSPSDSSSARFTSIIPAAVSSRSCLIFSIVLAKAPTSPRSLRSFRPALPLRRARHLLSQALPPQAPRRLQARRPQHRWPRPLVSQSRRPRPQNPAPLRRRIRPCLQARRRLLFRGGFRFRWGFWLVGWWPGTGPVVWRLGFTLRRLQHLGVHLGVFDHRRHRSFVDLHFLAASTGDDCVGDEPGDQADRTYCVVVAGDHIVYDLGVAVCIGEGEHRDLEPVGLFDQELLALGVYDKHTTGETLHLGYAGEVAP